MRPAEDLLRVQKNSQPENPTKFNYLQSDQNLSLMAEQMRIRILQTISEEPSEDKGSVQIQSEGNTSTTRKYKKLNDNIADHRSSPEVKYVVVEESIGINSDLISAKVFNDYDSFAKPSNFINLNQLKYQSKCLQCVFYSNKIFELQTTYDLLLEAKNQQLQQCKTIIFGLEQKLKLAEKRSQQEIDRNKRFRLQMERKNNEEFHCRQRQNEIIEYLKNREIALLEQLKQFENKIYTHSINGAITKKIKISSSPRVSFNSKIFNSQTNVNQCEARSKKNPVQSSSENSVSQLSGKAFDQIFDTQNNANFWHDSKGRQSSTSKLLASSLSKTLLDRAPLSEVVKRANQLQCLKDDLRVSQLREKIEKTKTLEAILSIS